MKLTEAATGAFLENLNLLKAELNVIARHPRKDWIAVGGEDRFPYLYTMDRPRALRVGEESTLVRQLERQDGSIIALAFGLDGRRLAVGGAATEVRIYDTDSGQRVSTLAGHEGGVYTAAFHPNGQHLITGGFDGTLRIFETESGKLVKSFSPVPLEKSAVSMK